MSWEKGGQWGLSHPGPGVSSEGVGDQSGQDPCLVPLTPGQCVSVVHLGVIRTWDK